MDHASTGLLIVTTTPAPGVSEPDFHRWYDEVHVPELRQRVPGIESVERYRGSDAEHPTRFVAVYRISRPANDVLADMRTPGVPGAAAFVDVAAHPPVIAGFDAIG
ncbi:hypothetical protein JOD63_003412 [Microbacterium terrae]|uniref:EthD protein n=1 Tax=Microbacterium terrae TaxID=69369 RepID=A0A0M2HBY4_9MICO|nr:hypothetical protein [Microbacterium terrae]KJL44022.1 hypothetical protein RS81_00595 [Microbacterium terrae]MBP1079444.1 hypothetical protein [Microbacterium terrae]GLJ98845.1 hypothetical protein GCM10017594_20420 [Microbacterium terrae]